jgi:hypothetical protein
VLLSTSVGVSGVFAESEEKVSFRQNTGLQAYYLNINAMIYFKFKLQRKLRNKSYTSVRVNSHTD